MPSTHQRPFKQNLPRERDLNIIENQINNASASLVNANEQMKMIIAECISKRKQSDITRQTSQDLVLIVPQVDDVSTMDNNIPTKLKKNEKKTKSTKNTSTRESTGERKVYGTRSQLSKPPPTSFPVNDNEQDEEASLQEMDEGDIQRPTSSVESISCFSP